ncbi:hypothetical protein ACHAW6_014039 [Cyclotella cf. meneghiniana]
MNQTIKNVRSTKPKAPPVESTNTTSLCDKKIQDVYTTVYDPRKTTFSDQTGQFPTRSLCGNKYIMVLVKLDSNAILLEPIKNCPGQELHAPTVLSSSAFAVPAYLPKNMSWTIKDHHKLTLKLFPPGCHQCNAAKFAIRNFKSHFLSVLAGMAPSFPPSLWNCLLPQTEITFNLLQQSNATPTAS